MNLEKVQKNPYSLGKLWRKNNRRIYIMKNIFGNKISKTDLIKKVGSMSNFAYVKPFQYTEGKATGVNGFEISNGTGLDFTVLESKCLDIVSMKYKGMSLNYSPKTGIVSPALSDMNGSEFRRSIVGGMMYTCGLLNVGSACEDNGMTHVFHGRIKTIPAEKVSVSSDWENDDFVIKISGEMKDGAIYGDNLVLRRTITTKTGAKSVKIHDELENLSYKDEEFMILYHVNAGYPVVDDGSRFVIPKGDLVPRIDGITDKNVSDCKKITGPIDNYAEHVFFHEVASDKDDNTGAAVINDKLGIGVFVNFNKKNLPYIVEWKSMMSGDYAFGILPSNNHAGGRLYERQNGTLRTIKAAEKLVFDLEIGVLEGADEIKDFESKINSLPKK
jgi:hypothetical protein